MPQMLGLDETSHILALEDCGAAQDFTTLYQGVKLTPGQLAELTEYLSRLHHLSNEVARHSIFANRAMRALNHLHIFAFPLQLANGFDLDAITPGLGKVAQALKLDEVYVQRVGKLGELYLRDGATLLHGDYFPGSWLQTTQGVRVIDPEFCFYGPAEFDLGVMIAHLHLAEQPADLASELLLSYNPARPLNQKLMRQFAGVEIMRRLIGVAQLPLKLSLEAKSALLSLSRELVLQPGVEE
jgi:5-methylthioribose kinase